MNEDEIKFQQACHYFNTQEYFEAHEAWEDLWHEASGPKHPLLQGLIQTAVALHHAGNGNWAGCKKLCSKAIGYLEKGKTASDTIDITALIDLILDFDIAADRKKSGEEIDLPYFQLPLKKI